MPLVTKNVHVVMGSNLTRVIMGPAEYQDIAAQIITDPPLCFTVGTRYSGLQAFLGIIRILTQFDLQNHVKDSSSDHITYFLSSDIQVL
jgi:hypothetical protein